MATPAPMHGTAPTLRSSPFAVSVALHAALVAGALSFTSSPNDVADATIGWRPADAVVPAAVATPPEPRPVIEPTREPELIRPEVPLEPFDAVAALLRHEPPPRGDEPAAFAERVRVVVRRAAPVIEAVPVPPAPEPTVVVRARPIDGANRSPEYPREARRRSEEGTVQLVLWVGVEGNVGEVRIGRSSGHPRLDRAAQQAAAQWRFAPATRDGVPIGSEFELDVEFRLVDRQ